MGYIRTDEDYYESLGMSPKEAAAQAEAERRCGHSGGYCNPRKATEFADTVEEVRKEQEDERKSR